jgi:small subunit ribosomal protein S18
MSNPSYSPSSEGGSRSGGYGGGSEGGRSNRGPRRDSAGGGGGGRERFSGRRRSCQFCVDKMTLIDYKDVGRLRKYLSERGKIEPRRKTGTCAKHQRTLTTSLKRARQLALLPYTAEHQRFIER